MCSASVFAQLRIAGDTLAIALEPDQVFAGDLSFSGFGQHSWYRWRVGPVIPADERSRDAVVSGDVNEDVAAGCLAFDDA
jgi:hypothetical protein